MVRMFTKVFSFILALITLLSIFLLPAAAVPAPIINPMLDTYVVDDLKKMSYNVDNYPKDASATHLQVIHFLEYGYTPGDTRYFGLYLYLYNPTGKELELDGHYLQMSCGAGSTDYSKYSLEVVSYSIDEWDKYVFYKLKLNGVNSIGRSINSVSRVYNLANLEVLYKDESEVVTKSWEKTASGNRKNVWTYQGYQKGFGSETGTLNYSVHELDTIPVELHDASWMSDTSSLGEEDYRWEVKSYYFNIPTSYIKTYGNIGDKNSGLVSVEGEYYKYGLNGLVVPTTELYNQYLPTTQIAGALDGYTLSDLPGFMKLGDVHTVENISEYHSKFSFNQKSSYFIDTKLLLYHYINSSPLPKLNLLSVGSSPYISKDALTELWKTFGKPVLASSSYMYIGDKVTNIGQRIRFEISVTDGDLGGSIKTYASQNKWGSLNWLHRLLNDELYTDADGYLNCMPLFEVHESDVSEAYKDDVQGKRLYFDYDSYSELQDFYYEMSSNNSVYIMRLGVEPYYETEVELLSSPSSSEQIGTGYYYEKVIHKGTDIFTFTFQRADGSRITVPVDCDPVDNLGSVVSGSNKDDGNPNGYPTDPSAGKIVDGWIRDLIDWIKSLKGIVILIGSTIGIVTILVLLVIFWRYLEPWFIRIGAVLGAAFRGLGRFFGALGRGLGAVFGGLFRLLFGIFKALWNIGFTVLFYFTGLDLRIRGGFDLGSGDTIVRDPDAGEKRERDRQRFKEEMNEAARKEERHRDELQDRAENRRQRREEELRKQERHEFELQSRANERELRNNEERFKQERHEARFREMKQRSKKR